MQDKHWYIIANPVSGAGKVATLWPAVETILQELGFSYTIHFTKAPGHAAQLADDAILNGKRFILGIGGDGTNHEIVNGILSQTHTPSTDIHYALLPAGTGNDWARQYRIPADPRKRLQQLLKGQTCLQDVGRVHYRDENGQDKQRFFVNVAGMAYDAYIVREVQRSGKVFDSKIAYLASVGKYLFSFTPPECIVVHGEGILRDFFYTINVGLCRYSGAGMQLTPHAVPDDGLFALTCARNMPRWEVLLQTPRFYQGTILKHRKVSGYQTRGVRVEAAGTDPVYVEADGEFLGCAPASFELLEKRLRIVL